MSDRWNKSNKSKSSYYGIKNIEEFKRLINENKTSGKDWYYGLKDRWWWGMSEEIAIRHVEDYFLPDTKFDGIVLISTWNINCGIATYTKYLLEELSKISQNSFVINPINRGILSQRINGRLTHLQHEYGILPTIPAIKSKVIITWHTVLKDIHNTIKAFESEYDVVAHIVHSERARDSMKSSRDILVVPHGSMLIPEMKKEDARRLLGMNVDMPVGFVFGFQSGDKNYNRLISAAKHTGIHLMISGAPHDLVRSISIANSRNVTFINRYLTESEVSLYALASDVLLFDYVGKDHYSVSGAMHRIIGAGRPVVCSDIKHFKDIEDDKHCLKFKDQEELEKCIVCAIKDSGQLSLAAREYAEMTSWPNVARRHVEIYKKYSNVSSLKLIK